MKLFIEIDAPTGQEMEDNLNMAITDLADVFKKKGFRELELIGYKDDVFTEPVYKINLKPNHAGKQTGDEKADN